MFIVGGDRFKRIAEAFWNSPVFKIVAYLNVRVFPVIIIAFVRCIRAPVFVAVKTVFKVADGRMIIVNISVGILKVKRLVGMAVCILI